MWFVKNWPGFVILPTYLFYSLMKWNIQERIIIPARPEDLVSLECCVPGCEQARIGLSSRYMEDHVVKTHEKYYHKYGLKRSLQVIDFTSQSNFKRDSVFNDPTETRDTISYSTHTHHRIVSSLDIYNLTLKKNIMNVCSVLCSVSISALVWGNYNLNIVLK